MIELTEQQVRALEHPQALVKETEPDPNLTPFFFLK